MLFGLLSALEGVYIDHIEKALKNLKWVILFLKNSGDRNKKWHEEVDKLDKKYFPDVSKNPRVIDLKEQAKGLRVWAKPLRFSVAIKKNIKKDKKDSYGGWLIAEKIKNCYKNIK